jgi:hypothetical protein
LKATSKLAAIACALSIGLLGTAVSPASAVPGDFVIVNKHTKKCLEFNGMRKAVTQEKCNKKSKWQRWGNFYMDGQQMIQTTASGSSPGGGCLRAPSRYEKRVTADWCSKSRTSWAYPTLGNKKKTIFGNHDKGGYLKVTRRGKVVNGKRVKNNRMWWYVDRSR